MPDTTTNSFLVRMIQIGSGTNSAFYVMCIGALSPGVNGPDDKSDHSPPSSAGVMNEWSYTSILSCGFTACIGTTCPLSIPLTNEYFNVWPILWERPSCRFPSQLRLGIRAMDCCGLYYNVKLQNRPRA
jgi:hypothetical protein